MPLWKKKKIQPVELRIKRFQDLKDTEYYPRPTLGIALCLHSHT